MSAVAALLPDGRLHLQHGPIDCLCRAWGEPGEVQAAYGQAARFFASVLGSLCAELPLLRSPLPTCPPTGRIASAMHRACMPFAHRFITPMAAVAGGVADAVLAALVDGRAVTRAFVNNGGDIAFHLTPGTSLRCGLVTDLSVGSITSPTLRALGGAEPDCVMAGPTGRLAANPADSVPGNGVPETGVPADGVPAYGVPADGVIATRTDRVMAGMAHPLTARMAPAQIDRVSGTESPPPFPSVDGTFLLTADHPARGLATSGRACKGRGGRSFSFGIADSVSVLARTAAQADAAATVICNAVDLPGHDAIHRRPANEIDPDSDLGDRLVTFDIGALTDEAIDTALDAGAQCADILVFDGLIDGAVLALGGRLRIRHPSLALLESP
jgi:ApbE superfamily uncharacterized protein (UPF0280 family)